MAVIEVNHVSKVFELGHLHSIKLGLKRAIARLQGSAAPERRSFKALDDIDFRIEQGEVVGVIGHNGAGKSTLLKILSRITVPTTGSVRVTGRIAPLIELGTGFVGDLTGRENIYLNGAILGMRRAAIERRFDEIVAFSELEAFIDSPLKHYSTGMTMRLAFSIATSVEADVLLMDEVLAVGDLAFYRKCFDRLERMIKDEQRTILLVSHNLLQVGRVCSRALLLDGGRLLLDGPVADVCNRYYEAMDEKIHRDAEALSHSRQDQIRSSGQVTLVSLRLLNERGEESTTLVHDAALRVEMVVDIHEELVNPEFAVGVQTVELLPVTFSRSAVPAIPETLSPGRATIVCSFDRLALLPGAYALKVGIAEGRLQRTILYGENLRPFRVVSDAHARSVIGNQGFLVLNGSWSVAR